jgi:hypothetical protein
MNENGVRRKYTADRGKQTQFLRPYEYFRSSRYAGAVLRWPHPHSLGITAASLALK